MSRWHHQLSGHELDKLQEKRVGQASRACCSPRVAAKVGHYLATEQQREGVATIKVNHIITSEILCQPLHSSHYFREKNTLLPNKIHMSLNTDTQRIYKGPEFKPL